MAFWGGLANKVASKFNQIKNEVITRLSKPAVVVKKDDVNFTIIADTKHAQASAEASILIFFDRQISNELARQIGQSGVDTIGELLQPVSRTGALVSSFKHRYNTGDNSITIYSNDPASRGIQTGIRHTGHTEELVKWLKTKSEHSGKTDKQLKRLAYHIKRKIERGDSPGGNSTLKSLNPVGERRYDYIGETVQRLTQDIEGMLTDYARGIG